MSPIAEALGGCESALHHRAEIIPGALLRPRGATAPRNALDPGA
jgi:hypothetical protein